MLTLLRWLYSALWLLFMPLVILRLYWRGRVNPAYRENIAQRLGFYQSSPFPQGETVFWVHAVSVGEVNVAVPLILAILKARPQTRFVVTTMTPTGKAQLLKQIQQHQLENQVCHSYVPYDVPCFIRRFIKNYRPEKLIVLETELWPNLYHVVKQHQIPLYIVNMRISVKSFPGYVRAKRFLKPTLQAVTAFLVQTDEDSKRVKAMGAAADKVHVAGNIKYDNTVRASDAQAGKALREKLGDRPVWIAASTHDGEDEIMLAVQEKLLKKQPDVLCIIVPRHPERFERVNTLIEKAGLKHIRFSDFDRRENQWQSAQVMLGDTMGDLLKLFHAADIAFVGNSLTTSGGHNLLEPLMAGKAVIHGPLMHNFVRLQQQLAEAGGAYEVKDAAEMEQVLTKWLDNTLNEAQSVENAQKVIRQNLGATQRCLDFILAG